MQEIWRTSEVSGWGEGKKATQRFPWPSFQRRSPFAWRDAFFPSSVQCGFGFIHIGDFNFFTCCQALPYAANLIFHAPPIFSWKRGGRQRWPLQVIGLKACTVSEQTPCGGQSPFSLLFCLRGLCLLQYRIVRTRVSCCACKPQGSQWVSGVVNAAIPVVLAD